MLASLIAAIKHNDHPIYIYTYYSSVSFPGLHNEMIAILILVVLSVLFTAFKVLLQKTLHQGEGFSCVHCYLFGCPVGYRMA